MEYLKVYFFNFSDILPIKRIAWYSGVIMRIIRKSSIGFTFQDINYKLIEVYIWGSWFMLKCFLDICNAVLSLSHFNFCYIKLSFAEFCILCNPFQNRIRQKCLFLIGFCYSNELINRKWIVIDSNIPFEG